MKREIVNGSRRGVLPLRLISALLLSFFALLFPQSEFVNYAGAEAAGKKSIVVTTNILADLVQKIVGDKLQSQGFTVTALMQPGVDPHLYKATQGDIRRLADADLIFYNGHQLEGKMAEVLSKMGKRTPTLGVAEVLPESDLRSAEDIGKIFDPHIWFDPLLWKKTISPIVGALAKEFPEEESHFQKNGQLVTAELIELDQWISKQLSKVSKEHRVLVTAHDAFGYFGLRYDFEVIGLQGVSTASEFGLADLARITEVIMKRKIPAVFVESSVPKNFIQALIEGTQSKGFPLKLGGELYSDSLGQKGSDADTYEKMARHNVLVIAEALGR